MTIDLTTVTHETFAPYVSTVFTVETEAGPVELTLDNIKLRSEATIRDNRVEIDGVVYPPRRAFALTFEGPREPVLSPQVYAFSHPLIGRLEMFLSGFRQDADCMLYESSFS